MPIILDIAPAAPVDLPPVAGTPADNFPLGIETALDEMMPLISLSAPNVAAPVAYRSICMAAIEFCERVRIWRHEDRVVLRENEAVEIDMPLGAELLRIESVTIGTRPLKAKSVAWLDENLRGWRDGSGMTSASVAEYFTQLEPGTLRAVPAVAGEALVCMVLKPAINCKTLPSFLVSKHHETLVDGVLGRLLLQPGQPYTNPAMAAYHQRRFADKLDTLASSSSRGEQGARTRSRATYF